MLHKEHILMKNLKKSFQNINKLFDSWRSVIVLINVSFHWWRWKMESKERSYKVGEDTKKDRREKRCEIINKSK